MNNKKGIFVSILLPLVFTVAMLLFFPFRYRFEFDFDEGVNLIKAMLSMRGYRLYTDVWSDQPPVFTALLALGFKFLGLKVTAGRLLVLGFSTLLLISTTDYLYRKWGFLQAISGIVLIVTLPFYTTLSVSIMIGLPSIAFAMMALTLLTRWQETDKTSWLLLSATFLGLSMMTKIWTVILAPIFFAGILIHKSGYRRGKINLHECIRPLILWSLGFILVAVAILLLLVGPDNIDQLISPHLEASKTDRMQALASEGRLVGFLDDSIMLFILAPFGVYTAFKSKGWHAFYLVAWALAATLLLSWNAPFWYHHQLLITIPTAMLGSIAIGSALVELYRRLRTSMLWKSMTLFHLTVLLLSVVLAYQRIPKSFNNFRLDLPNLGTYDPVDDVDFEIVGLIGKYADKTHYLFTDRPMYAFRSGMAVPPGLAVITQKRYITGQPTQDEITAILEETKPEQVIISRFSIPAVQKYMETRNFVRVDNSPRSRHFVRGDIYENP